MQYKEQITRINKTEALLGVFVLHINNVFE